jgi:DNA-binding NarL/FixJ family response regulator
MLTVKNLQADRGDRFPGQNLRTDQHRPRAGRRTSPIRVLVAAERPLVRSGLRAMLAAQPDLAVVADVASGEEVVRAAAAHTPDVVLMQLDLAGGDGLDIIGKIVADAGRYGVPGRPVHVLAMAAEWSPRQAFAALRAGATGLLLNGRPTDVLLGAVRAVAVAGIWLDPAMARDVLIELTSQPVVGDTPSGVVRRLTAREREVLVLLAHGLGSADIADRLFLSAATVRTHVGRILMKLDCQDRTRAVVVAYRSGLVRGPL